VPAAEDVGKCRGEEDLGFGLDIAAVFSREVCDYSKVRFSPVRASRLDDDYE
jgi:hypothetical protein